MPYFRRSRNHLVIQPTIALAIAVLVYGCTPTTTTPITSNTPSGSESSPSSAPPSTVTPTLQPPNQEQTAILRANQTVIGGSVQQKLAQVFTVTLSGHISHIALPLDCQSAAMLTIRIETASSGGPGGQVLASQVVPGTELSSLRNGTTGNFTIIAFTDPPPVSSGALYAFTLETYGGDCGFYWGPPGDTYPAGHAYFEALGNPPGWSELDDPERDLAFQIFIIDFNFYE